ncbi:glycine betaine ABC transporter substrate-binding protein [Jeotgalibacillus proteolyticus]|uniref:Glycine/betaine ABC transporter substrate-binding protein n=1 Tax=Jeotgalibacillus proteolyticus TaxID=2082395 RepID=A0A2S5GFY3_9BACL|nr:glycine betaine ABC transporter substrate-binding protein [Jeotgalibacillus proteolyticus]PPA71937.1 glycine/betaine ABC transporter substrate-binding protein [Jeotgalibacillus proteolyticus]
MNISKGLLLTAAGTAILLAGCNTGGDGAERDSSEPIVISGKPWTEQYILPHILQQYIEHHSDYDVELQEGLGEVAILQPAMENGEIDLYVEYTGTGLEAVLDERAEEGESSESILDRVRQGYEEEFNITWLEPLGFANDYTMAFSEDADFQASTYSDLVELSSELTFGAPHAFYERQGDGYDAIVEAYGFDFAQTESLDANIMYQAVQQGQVDVIPAFTTDGRIERFNLQTTEDDLGFFPKYDAAPVVRQDVLEAYPELEEVLNGLAGQISEEDMQEMNAKVDIDGEDYAAVAEEFLQSKGLLD